MSPTGKAAFHIKGNTIHTGLKIQPNKKLEHKPLSASSLNSLRKSIDEVSLVIIYEISMVGCRMFNCINQRLMEVKGSHKPFGGVSVICVGDLFQLRPVCDTWIFNNPDDTYSALSPNLWTEMFSMFELTEIMRQAEEKDFAELLNRLREGNNTNQDIATLKQRECKQSEISNDIVHLFSKNEDVNNFNDRVLRTSSRRKIKSIAFDKIANI